MRLFTKNNKLVVGVDITTTAIKMVEITRQQGLFHLRNYGIEPLPRGAVVDKNIVDIDAVSDALARLSRGRGFSSKHIATAVSGSSIISKIIEMEADLTELERESRIRLDADQYIPYPLSEVNLDFEVIGPSATPDICRVLLVASRTENVDQRVDAGALAGLDTKIVDVEAYAVERAFQLMVDSLPGQPEHVALIDNIAINDFVSNAHLGGNIS